MEPIIHAIIPSLILLSFFPNLDKKYIFYLLPIVWLIDLDTFISTTHRFLFHNFFFIGLIALILYFAWDKKASLVGFFYGTSHLIFDLAYPGVAMFYPVYQKTIYLTAYVLNNSSWITSFSLGTLSKQEYLIGLESLDYSTWLSEQPILIFILIFITLIFVYRKRVTSFFSR